MFLPFLYASGLSTVRHAQTEQFIVSANVFGGGILGYATKGIKPMKREWRTIHSIFGGIRLYSMAVEHTIAMINIIVQHYGAETMLARKFSASFEAMQLEIGCAGNPLNEGYDRFHCLAMPS